MCAGTFIDDCSAGRGRQCAARGYAFLCVGVLGDMRIVFALISNVCLYVLSHAARVVLPLPQVIAAMERRGVTPDADTFTQLHDVFSYFPQPLKTTKTTASSKT